MPEHGQYAANERQRLLDVEKRLGRLQLAVARYFIDIDADVRDSFGPETAERWLARAYTTSFEAGSASSPLTGNPSSAPGRSAQEEGTR